MYREEMLLLSISGGQDITQWVNARKPQGG